jgi:hypothetical protein
MLDGAKTKTLKYQDLEESKYWRKIQSNNREYCEWNFKHLP